jgi:hypothetical protein
MDKVLSVLFFALKQGISIPKAVKKRIPFFLFHFYKFHKMDTLNLTLFPHSLKKEINMSNKKDSGVYQLDNGYWKSMIVLQSCITPKT